jgi:hypothetical protein
MLSSFQHPVFSLLGEILKQVQDDTSGEFQMSLFRYLLRSNISQSRSFQASEIILQKLRRTYHGLFPHLLRINDSRTINPRIGGF